MKPKKEPRRGEVSPPALRKETVEMGLAPGMDGGTSVLAVLENGRVIVPVSV
jgi:hypothetical protein